MLRLAVGLFTVLAAAPPAAAQAGGQAQSIRAGTYDLAVTYGGGVLDGTLVLEYKGDSVAVKLTVGEHEPTIRTIVRKGTRITLAGGAAGMALVYTLDFKGDALTGTFTFDGVDGTVTGTRRTAKAG
ncbi:MAG: hypothetical protein HOP28_12370 [Gemmatimonadales bacterium]|nr:hypothetical protein [Gemmatimonadales bacterium]